MNRLKIAIGIIFMVSSILVAQEAERSNSLKEGAWAAQFQITGNFTLSSFQGTALSIKRHYTEHTALRFGIGFGISTNTNDNDRSFSPVDTVGSTQSSDENSQNFDVRTQILYYPSPGSDVNFFFGAGPQVRYGRLNSESESMNSSSGSTTFSKNVREFTRWGIGLGGVFGVEWFATKSLSLHAEYSSSLEYVWSQSTQKLQSSTSSQSAAYEDTNKQFFISPAYVRFGLSAYF